MQGVKKRAIYGLLCGALLAVSGTAWARGTYQAPDDFVREVFAGKMPAVKTIWITDTMQPEIKRILGHLYAQQRVRYWQESGRSAWVLEEVGKEEPITTGIVVNAGKIEQVRVLVYRESRGDEVRYPRFTRQFKGAGLNSNQEFDRGIDVISGATLSVNALTRLARLALYLDSQAQAGK